MVGFCDLVGTGIAPVSKKTTVNMIVIYVIIQLVWKFALTAVFFETGAMPVPTKSRNPTICGWGDPFHSYLTHS